MQMIHPTPAAGRDSRVTGTPQSGDRASKHYSIRSLLVFTAAVGCWCALFEMLPQVAIYVSGLVLAAITTSQWARRRQLRSGRVSRFATILFTIASWSYLYVVSIGPAIVIAKYQDRSDIMVIFAPVGWLHATTPLRKPLERYAELWNGIDLSA